MWTAQEDALLRAHAQRLSSREIGARLGRTAKAVQMRAARLGLSTKLVGERCNFAKHSDRQVEYARQLDEEGKSVAEIVELTGAPRSTVYYWLSYRTRLEPTPE